MVGNEAQRGPDVGCVIPEEEPADARQNGQVPVEARRDARVQILEHVAPRGLRGPSLGHHRANLPPIPVASVTASGGLVLVSMVAPGAAPVAPGTDPGRCRNRLRYPPQLPRLYPARMPQV